MVGVARTLDRAGAADPTGGCLPWLSVTEPAAVDSTGLPVVAAAETGGEACDRVALSTGTPAAGEPVDAWRGEEGTGPVLADDRAASTGLPAAGEAVDAWWR